MINLWVPFADSYLCVSGGAVRRLCWAPWSWSLSCVSLRCSSPSMRCTPSPAFLLVPAPVDHSPEYLSCVRTASYVEIGNQHVMLEMQFWKWKKIHPISFWTYPHPDGGWGEGCAHTLSVIKLVSGHTMRVRIEEACIYSLLQWITAIRTMKKHWRF